MAWNRNEPDPLEARKRQLAEQERELAEKRRRLTEHLQASPEAGAQAKRAEPLVWRSEEDSPRTQRAVEPTPARKRNLARQTQRDMVFVIILVVLLVIVIGLVLWVAHVHTLAAGA